ncbi:MAG: CehA/McbA family metallohydrolase [Synergistaceae bacterium]|nr:CehA/McbA family metallohydrolase [Synergistaceae bacterium]
MKKTTFIPEGQFYKGNIHCHSTRSDGHLSPEKVVEAYRGKGYHFIAFTEHNLYSDFSKFNGDGFITIQSVEASPAMPEGEIRAYHFIALPGDSARRENASLPMYRHGDETPCAPFFSFGDLQEFIDNFYNRGYMVMINHPFWSRIEYDEILPLKNLFALEIYNFCSGVIENMAESNVCYDALLRNGMKLWCAAVDDNHNEFALTGARCDSFGGFIRVKAESLRESDICDAIARGSFYSSTGPEIYDFYLDGDEVHFSSSPAARIYVLGDVRQILSSAAEDSEHLLTGVTGKISGDERYIRVECYDINGKKAYTNPIFL